MENMTVYVIKIYIDRKIRWWSGGEMLGKADPGFSAKREGGGGEGG